MSTQILVVYEKHREKNSRHHEEVRVAIAPLSERVAGAVSSSAPLSKLVRPRLNTAYAAYIS